MANWNVAGIQNRTATLFNAGQSSRRAYDFGDPSINANHKRPDALYRASGDQIEIRTGGRVTRNRSVWGGFKRNFTGFLYAVTFGKIFPKKFSARSLRHAEFERDKVVNKLVADIANGANKGKRADRMNQLKKLQVSIRGKVETDAKAKGMSAQDAKWHAEAVSNEQLKLAVKESLMAAFKANPDRAEHVLKETMALFNGHDVCGVPNDSDAVEETQRVVRQGIHGARREARVG